MKNQTLTPHQSLKTIWFIELILIFIGVYILPIIPLIYANQMISIIIYSIFILPWFILALWWIPTFFNTIKYTLKDDHIEIDKGVWWQQNKTIPFLKITDVKAIQGPLQRHFSLGSLYLQTAGMGTQNTAEGRLTGLTEYKQKQQDLLNYIRNRYSSTESKEGGEERKESKQDTYLKNILKTLHQIEKELRNK